MKSMGGRKLNTLLLEAGCRQRQQSCGSKTELLAAMSWGRNGASEDGEAKYQQFEQYVGLESIRGNSRSS